MTQTSSQTPATNDKEAQFIEVLATVKSKLLTELHKVIIGQDDVIELLLAALFARGHCLIRRRAGARQDADDQHLARVLKLNFNRVQFTPDLMPADITGTDVLEEDQTTGRRTFRFVKGPIFSNIFFADEINRTRQTQSALLQAMQEYQVTAGGHTYALEPPFLCWPRKIPSRQEGTYPLPEAQLDRFHVHGEYWLSEQEGRAPDRPPNHDGDGRRSAGVLSAADILHVQKVLRKLPVSDHVVDYAVNLVRATRPKEPGTPAFINELADVGSGPARGSVSGARAKPGRSWPAG